MRFPFHSVNVHVMRAELIHADFTQPWLPGRLALVGSGLFLVLESVFSHFDSAFF